jgi:hypothetical protein
MKQVLHIFAKDVRRFWPEILISLAITAAFARIYPQTWLAAEAVSAGEAAYAFQSQMDKLAATLVVLVPVSWFLLITRVVHAESLVGDKQFWITRPYDWRKLLAAKLLFVAAFVYLPFSCAELALLAEGGFRPFAYLPELLLLLVLISVLVVPLFTLAALTKNFARMTMTLLGVLACVAGAGFATTLDDSPSVTTPYSDRYTVPLILLVCGSAIVVQYARRKVWLARSLLLALPLVGGIVVLAAYALPDSSVDSAYPEARADAHGVMDFPALLSYAAASKNPVSVHSGSKDGLIGVQIAIRVEGVAPGHAVLLENLKASIDGPNGAHWSLPWEGLYNRRFLPGAYETWVDLRMKRVDFERLKQAPATVKVTFGLTEVRAGTVTRAMFSERPFEIPKFGICPGSTPEHEHSEQNDLQCRSAFHGPALMYVSALEAAEPCGTGQAETKEKIAVGDWVGSLNNYPADFGMTPVWATLLYMRNTDGSQMHFLCPGMPITFTQYDLARRMRMEISIPNLKLPDETRVSNTILNLKSDD